MISIIAAVARNRAIGFENKLIYWLPNDLKRFKALTTGHTIIMGRNTFLSLPKGALPNRRNIVLSRSQKEFPGCDTYASLVEALAHCASDEDVYIIGGASVYKQALPLADRLCLTEIDDTPAQADTYFPDYSDWHEVSREAHEADERHAYRYLHMTGWLNNPILSFSLEFPLSDQAVQQQVRQIINTDEMLMRQVIYLLVFGRFLTPDYMSNAQYATINSTYSLLSSTVTSQINAWLGKLTNMVTLGVAIRTDGEGPSSSQEYEAQFQLQPVDRLVINGNVGYRYNDVSNQPFFGDLDVEVLLTEDGQWRMKGYTHTVDKYSLRQASTIQGVGFMWKRDFNWPTKKDREERKAKKAKVSQ